MAYLNPETTAQAARLIAAYDTPRRSLLDRGIALRAAPDLAGFRRYLAARQRAEEIAQAEAAIADGVRVGRRRWFGRQAVEDIPDPQLRPVTWAVPRRRNRPTVKTDEVVGPFDIEDAHVHRGLEAHAFVVNADSASSAVCGFQPRWKKVPGGGRLAELAVASLETNRKCLRCLVLLYQAALAGGSDTGPWPSAEVAQPDAAVAPSADGERFVEVPIESEPAAEAVAEAEPLAAGEVHPEGEDHSEPEEYPDREDYSELEPAVAEIAAEYGAPTEPGEHEIQPDQPEHEPAMVTESSRSIVIPIVWDADHEDLQAAAAEVDVEETEIGSPQLTLLHGVSDPLDTVLEPGAQDVLVITAAGRTAMIVGGLGRGADWAGTVLDTEHEPILRRVWSSNRALHRDGTEAQRICGPYWAKAAVLVPVGETACVVFGSPEPLELSEQLFLDAARAAAERFEQPSPDIALADEREVSIALRRIMEGADLSFEAALDHVLGTTASVLGCSIAAGVARMGRRLALRAIDLDGADNLDPAMLLGGGAMLHGEQGVSVEENDSIGQGHSAVVSRLRLPLSGSNVEGTLVVTHTARRPRGFTTQDQRLAEAIAPAAVVVLERAGFGEGLRALESHMRAAPATDPLTGLANKAAWEQAIASEADRIARSGGSAAVAAFRIDGLQRIDERQGPLARDAALRQAAELVRRLSRSTDVAARVGEDEFRVLVRDGGATGARRLAIRIRRAAREAQSTDTAPPMLAVSWAAAQSRSQLMAAGRLVGQRLRSRARSSADPPRVGTGRTH